MNEKIYLLNSAVITTPGLYQYTLLDIKTAKAYIEEHKNEIVSYIGYEETAEAFEKLLGWYPEINRSTIKMKKRDIAIVFRLTHRVTDKDLKGIIGVDEIIKNCEIGILKKLV